MTNTLLIKGYTVLENRKSHYSYGISIILEDDQSVYINSDQSDGISFMQRSKTFAVLEDISPIR